MLMRQLEKAANGWRKQSHEALQLPSRCRGCKAVGILALDLSKQAHYCIGKSLLDLFPALACSIPLAPLACPPSDKPRRV